MKNQNVANKCVGGQSDLESEDSDNNGPNEIENIINQKSKTIADVLLNDGLSNFYGNYFQKHMKGLGAHPFAKKSAPKQGLQQSLKKQIPQPSNPYSQTYNKSSIQPNSTVEFSFDENENQQDFKLMMNMPPSQNPNINQQVIIKNSKIV